MDSKASRLNPTESRWAEFLGSHHSEEFLLGWGVPGSTTEFFRAAQGSLTAAAPGGVLRSSDVRQRQSKLFGFPSALVCSEERLEVCQGTNLLCMIDSRPRAADFAFLWHSWHPSSISSSYDEAG